MVRRARGLAAALCLLAAAAAPPAASAATRTWDGTAGDGDWANPANWDGDVAVPAAGDVVVIAAPGAIANVPGDVVFAAVRLSDGATLASLASGAALSTGDLVAGCATSAIPIATTGAVDVYGLRLAPSSPAAPVDLAVHGSLTVRAPLASEHGCDGAPAADPGTLDLAPASSLTSTGTLAGGGTVRGSGASTAGGIVYPTVTSAAGGVIDGASRLRLESVHLVDLGAIRHGTVTLAGGSHVLGGTASLEQVEVVADGAALSTGSPGTPTTTTVTLGAGARLTLRGTSDLSGLGRWAGPGTLGFQGGVIRGRQTVAAGTRLAVSGTAQKAIAGTGGAGPAELVVDGAMTLGTAPLRIGGQLVLRGTLDVTQGAEPVVTGVACCTEPVNGIRVERTGKATVARGATLTLRDLRLDNAGLVWGPGLAILERGAHILRDGSELGVETRIRADVAVQGTSTVSAPVVQSAGTLSAPQVAGRTPRAQLDGTGWWTVEGGGITGDLTFLPSLRLTLTGPQQKLVGAGSDIRAQGAVEIAGPGPLRMPPGTLLRLAGASRFGGATIAVSGRGRTAPRLDVTGPLVLAKGVAGTRIVGVRTTFAALVAVKATTFQVDGIAPHLVRTARLVLGGGRLRSDRGLVVDPRARIIGPGKVLAKSVTVNGRIRFERRGVLAIVGSLALGPRSVVALDADGGARDAIVVSGRATLRGRLALSGVAGLPARARWQLLRAARGRIGTFGSVTGSAGRAIVYDARSARL